MSFELTDKLTNQIIEALENQEQEFVVDAENSTLVCKESVSSDNANYYSLPQWNSTEGFNLRQEFVSNLHAPLVREELQKILHSGRGVFKNFKLTLKQYPEVEKLYEAIKVLPKSKIVEAEALAKEAGNSKAENMVLVGAALDYIPVKKDTIINSVKERFASKDPKLVEINCTAIELGSTAK